MDNFDTLEKLEEYIKQANFYGEYNYCFIKSFHLYGNHKEVLNIRI